MACKTKKLPHGYFYLQKQLIIIFPIFFKPDVNFRAKAVQEAIQGYIIK